MRRPNSGASTSSGATISTVEFDDRCDVLVVGAGGAGLAAAIEAATRGANVVVVEKNPQAGGTTGMSVGSITATGTRHQARAGVTDSTQDHAEDLATMGLKRNASDNPALRTLLTERVPDTMRWLHGLGVEFVGPLPEPPHRKSRMHCVVPTSQAYVDRLTKKARVLGVDIRCNRRTRELIKNGDRVTGAVVTVSPGTAVRIAAGAVILATGDYSANADMVAEYVSPAAARAKPVNPASTGDGQRMGMAVGGELLNSQLALITIRFPAPAKRSLVARLPTWPLIARAIRLAYEHLPQALVRPFMVAFITSVLQPARAFYQSGAILVDAKGERLGDETTDLALTLVERGGAAYVVFDSRLAEKYSQWPDFLSTAPGVGYAYVQDYKRHRRDLWHEGGDLAMLAGSLRVPADKLKSTVLRYNENDAKGARLLLDHPPFYALGPLQTVLVFTDGGLAVDVDLHVLRGDRSIVPGLYAAGAAGQGGVLLEGHGHHIGWALTSGRLAGANAAAEALADISSLAALDASNFEVQDMQHRFP